MSGFAPDQLKKLSKRLDPARVHTREINGRQIDYIEGWFAIAEANAIFGYAGWDREMAHFDRVFARTQPRGTECAYVARVRVRVHAGDRVILREGTGFGHALAPSSADAHERALKAAETDATKRALATFGNRFGLSLYDKVQGAAAPKQAESQPSHPPKTPASGVANLFELKTDDGTILAARLSPEGFCSGLRQLTEGTRVASEIKGLRLHNAEALATLRATVPELKSDSGKHYADILGTLMEKRERMLLAAMPTDLRDTGPKAAIALAPPAGQAGIVPELPVQVIEPVAPQKAPLEGPAKESRIGPGPVIDKSALALASPRRIRNKAHLARVGANPCLICEEGPCHAHHVTFAQPRGLSVKVSDEFTVPLCVLHHNDLHRAGNEKAWWRKIGIDPIAAAFALWQETLGVTTPPLSRAPPHVADD